MMTHLSLLNFRLFFAVYTAAAVALTAQADGFALLPPFLGDETVEGDAGTFPLKIPFILLLT